MPIERPQKRRRVSPAEEADANSGSDSSSSDVDSGAERRAHPDPLTHTCDTDAESRIKVKKASQPGALSRLEDGAPQFIIASNYKDEESTFATLGLDLWLIASLSHMAIKYPTRIQKSSIPEILSGRDCIGSSRTGSGKTVAFTVPILQQWARHPSGFFAVVMTPTRELALQIYEQIQAIGARAGVRCCLVTGGADMTKQALELGKMPHVVVATPGRLAAHVETSGEDTIGGLRRAKFVVLDEADRLLAAGQGSMLDDLETCLSVMPSAAKRQTLLFTATVTPEVRVLKDMPRAKDREAVFVCEVDTEDLAVPEGLKQTYVFYPQKIDPDYRTDTCQLPTRQRHSQRKIPSRATPYTSERRQEYHHFLQPHFHGHFNRVHAPTT